MSEPTRIDELIATILPRNKLPSRLRPSHLLDDAVVPPPAVAEKVYALRALVKSGGSEEPLSGRLVSSRDVASYFRPLIGADTMESFWVIGLDAKNRVRVEHQVSRGGLTSCPVSPSDAIRPVVLNACVGAIAIHNHPSGDTSPSPEDIALTQRLAQGFDLLGLRLVDHVIVSTEGYFSFLDAGVLASR